ncbi:MAG TPA: hypothetical protein VIL50_05705, partial [Candidatus Limnocylindrales bacterium]
TVPATFIGHLPIGVSFIGGRWDEPKLIGLAYSYEQATHVRVPPTFLATESSTAATSGAASTIERRAVVPGGDGRSTTLRLR